MTTILATNVSDRDINQALYDLKNYEVCSTEAIMALIEKGYIQGHSQWFKPIPWALSCFALTDEGTRYVLSMEIDDLTAEGSQKLLDRDLFNPNEVEPKSTETLAFT